MQTTQYFVIPELGESERIAFGYEPSSRISLISNEIPAFAGMTKWGVA